MKKYIYIIFVIILFQVTCSSFSHDEIIISTDGVTIEFLQKYFDNEKVKYSLNGNFLYIEKCDNNKLIKLLSILKEKIVLNGLNIANANEINGGVYIRKYLDLKNDNEIEVEEDKSPLTLRYNPKHSNAMKQGKKKGYVYYPNVNYVYEQVELTSNVHLYNSIIDYLNKNNSNIIIHKINEDGEMRYKK